MAQTFRVISSRFRDRRNQSLKHSRLTASLAVQGRQMRMQLALLTTFAASRKEPVAEVLERVHAAIMASGQGEPSVMFTLSDGPIVRVSSIDRMLKRRPELKRFEQTTSPYPNGPSIRVL